MVIIYSVKGCSDVSDRLRSQATMDQDSMMTYILFKWYPLESSSDFFTTWLMAMSVWNFNRPAVSWTKACGGLFTKWRLFQRGCVLNSNWDHWTAPSTPAAPSIWESTCNYSRGVEKTVDIESCSQGSRISGSDGGGSINWRCSNWLASRDSGLEDHSLRSISCYVCFLNSREQPKDWQSFLYSSGSTVNSTDAWL